MITAKSKAIEAVSKPKVDFDEIDNRLLKDKDVVRAYMQHHSSNIILVSKVPIDIDSAGMIDNETFITDVIKNLDIGYDKNNLESLLKYSTSVIVKKKLNGKTETTEAELMAVARRILARYNVQVKRKVTELSEKQQLMDRLNAQIAGTMISGLIDSIDNANSGKSGERYKRNSIGFTAELKK